MSTITQLTWLNKQIVKFLNKDGDYFALVFYSFPSCRDEKKKAGIFDDCQIQKLMKPFFIDDTSSKRTWIRFCKIDTELPW